MKNTKNDALRSWPALTAESNYHPLPGVKCEVLNRYGVMRGHDTARRLCCRRAVHGRIIVGM